MEPLQTVWNLFLFFSIFALPQLLGVLAYYRVRRIHNLSAHLAGFLLPPILFFYFSRLLFAHPPHEDHAGGGCGMAAVAAGFIVLVGTAIQILVSLIAQLMLRARRGG